MTVAALLLGRGGSSGFPGKNLYPVLGRPLMAYPLMAARDSNHIDRVYVSTDSEEIMVVGCRYGAEIIIRPPELCTDEALGEDAYAHGYKVIRERLAENGGTVELMVLLFANAVTITGELIDQGIETLRADPSLDSAVTVSRYNMWSPLRARKLGDDGCLHPFVPFEIFGDPATLTCDRDSQGDAYFADMGVSVVRPHCLENMEEGLLPQKWMGQRIAPVYSWGGCDVDYKWQIPGIEYWLRQHGYAPADSNEEAVLEEGPLPDRETREGSCDIIVEKSAREVKVCADLADLSRQAAQQFADSALQAVAQNGRFTVCLSGGSTPRDTYALLARETFREQVPWSQVHIFWGDERCIPLDQSDNHYRMASDLMLSKVPIPAQNIHRMRGEAADPTQAADDYEALLRSFFNLSDEDIPRFDLILLGMGADGHTASLFPGSAALQDRQRLVVAHYVPKLEANRLTLTLPVLNHARKIMFLVAGEHKAGAVRAVFQGDEGQPKLPAQLVRFEEGTVLGMIDEAAASQLKIDGLGLD